MKVRDLQLYLRYSLSKDILLSFVRSNFLGLISIFVIVSCNRNNYKSGKISQATGIKLGEDGFDYKGLKFKDKKFFL